MSHASSKASDSRNQNGFTLVELLVTTTITALIFLGLGGVVRASLEARTALDARMTLIRESEFAMDRMVRAVNQSRLLLLPFPDEPTTNWREHVREQTVPPSPPEGDSVLATAVLAVTLPLYSDLDFDGFPDADNDRDGRIDEDPENDRNNDFAPGIYLIDDDGDGLVDEGFSGWDDDEAFGVWDEDPVNGLDDDGDGAIDEDPSADVNGDGCDGVCGVDDDGDGAIDESPNSDDDEDGTNNEDWYDAVVFYLDNGVVKERTPVPWDETGVSGITGRDFLTSDIASHVTRLRFERVAAPAGGLPLVDITLELTSVVGETVSLNRRVRVGSML